MATIKQIEYNLTVNVFEIAVIKMVLKNAYACEPPSSVDKAIMEHLISVLSEIARDV